MAPATQFGFILENIGGGEIVVIAFLALVVLGPERIPEMARGAGRMLHNFKKMTSEWTGDMQEIVNDPAMQPIRELGEFAVRPRQKLAEYALEAEAEERSKASAATEVEVEAGSEAEAPGSQAPDTGASVAEAPDTEAPDSGNGATPDEAAADAAASDEATPDDVAPQDSVPQEQTADEDQ
jgi:sec-independent protein translocase protein TatB